MTNQASEDDKAIMIGFLYGIQSDFLPADEVRHRMAGFRHTQGYKDAIELIRTEKLKLLAEVRERVVGEDETRIPSDGGPFTNTTDKLNHYITLRNANRADQRAALTKLEAEL